MKGGARVAAGRRADPAALRRSRPSDASGWLHLPASGREGPTPEWPLAIYRAKAVKAREAVVWEREWRRPQAIAWEQMGLETEVALYVRALVHAEKPRSATVTASDRTLVRQLMDDLGLSVAGLRSHHWIIDPADHELVEEDQGDAEAVSDADAESARDRFKLVVGQ